MCGMKERDPVEVRRDKRNDETDTVADISNTVVTAVQRNEIQQRHVEPQTKS